MFLFEVIKSFMNKELLLLRSESAYGFSGKISFMLSFSEGFRFRVAAQTANFSSLMEPLQQMKSDFCSYF